MRKVLIANRGEIAVRIVRACRDAGPGQRGRVRRARPGRAVRADGRRGVRAGRGDQPGETYLDIDKIIKVALRVRRGRRAPRLRVPGGERRLRPGRDRGGPDLDRSAAGGHRGARRQGAGPAHRPRGRGAADPGHARPGAATPRRSWRSPASTATPSRSRPRSAAAAAGLKVAWREEEVAEQYESAVREATAAFGRGECFVERYLDRPRHVETQCLADAHGHVVVISTRDCSLQRRHQKLVEEAPAPFLSAAQVEALYRVLEGDPAARPAYVGAGTCEFLVGQDGTISFLEVNTRLQVEHPVSEEVTGIDLVREMFRIAEGEPLGYDDPPARGHSIEFRINAEDPARNFLPAPGTITAWNLPSGPGVRVDAGYAAGHDGPAGVRLADRQADRDRREPGRGAAAFGPRAGRVRGRRDAHRAALPPGRGRGPRVRRRAAAGAHPLDRDRVRRPDAGPGARRGGRAGRAGDGSRSRWAGSGSRWWCRPPWACRAAAHPPQDRAERARGARRSQAGCSPWRERRHAGQPHAGHDHQDRGGGGAAGVGRATRW